MTTEKTPATLATVKHRGCVQLGQKDLSTSEGARRYVADYFTRELRRHDFADYISTRLAADFACALAQHLAARQPVKIAPQVCDACDRTGVRPNEQGRNIFCPDCYLGGACAGHDSSATAQAVDLPYSLDTDPAGIRARVADVITGTLWVASQGHTPPPTGHWLEPFWQAAHADAARSLNVTLRLRELVAATKFLRDRVVETRGAKCMGDLDYAIDEADKALIDSQPAGSIP